jgi:hypothetical protein
MAGLAVVSVIVEVVFLSYRHAKGTAPPEEGRQRACRRPPERRGSTPVGLGADR